MLKPLSLVPPSAFASAASESYEIAASLSFQIFCVVAGPSSILSPNHYPSRVTTQTDAAGPIPSPTTTTWQSSPSQNPLSRRDPPIFTQLNWAGCPLSVDAMSASTKRRTRLKDPEKAFISEKETSGATNGEVEVEDNPMCPICHEPVGIENLEGVIEKWSVLPCGHHFGSHCIKTYLRVVANERPGPCCPMCRQIAHHACGHPFLPVIRRIADITRMPPVRKKKAAERIQRLQSSNCLYCSPPPSGQLAGVPLVQTQTRPNRLRAASSWLLSVTKKPWTALKRRRRGVRRSGMMQSGGVLEPWQGDDEWADLASAFKRRDELWERWWDAQEPKTSG